MNTNLNTTICRMQRRLEVLRGRDLSTMGYETKARHEQRLRKLEFAIARAQEGVAAPEPASSTSSEREVRETLSTQ